MDTFDIETFSNLNLKLSDLGEKSRRYRFSANDVALKEAAQHLNILSVSSLVAILEVKRDSFSTGFHVVGHVKATVAQECVVTLLPVEQYVEVELNRHYVPLDRFKALTENEGEFVIDVTVTDDLEPLSSDTLDLKESVLEVVALNLDSYPRTEDADFENITDSSDEPKNNPFSVLAKLKKTKTDL